MEWRARRERPRRTERRALEKSFERSRRGVRVELERPRAARVRNPRAGVDDVDPLGPRCESVADRVVHVVHQHRQRQPESLDTGARRCKSVLEGGVIRKQDVVFEVRLQLPAVRRMCLGDVDERERRFVPVAPIQRLDIAGPATKRRSGEAAEDEDERAPVGQCPEWHGRAVLEPDEIEPWERITGGEALRPAKAPDRRDDDVALWHRE
jgi:hypothetical protein